MFKITQQSKENKRIKKKIDDLNRKIRRVKGVNKTKNKAKNRLISKRETLKLQLSDTTPKLIEGAFGGNYSKYRINGIEGMDLPTFFSKIRTSISNVLRKETSKRSIRAQTTTWIRYIKEDEYIDRAFNSINIFMVRLQDKHICDAHSLFPIDIPTVSSGLKIYLMLVSIWSTTVVLRMLLSG